METINLDKLLSLQNKESCKSLRLTNPACYVKNSATSSPNLLYNIKKVIHNELKNIKIYNIA